MSALWRAVRYDLKCGARMHWFLWCVPAILSIFFASDALRTVQMWQVVKGIDGNFSFPALLLALYAGNQPFEPANPEEFRLSGLWMAQQIWMLFMVYLYPVLCLKRAEKGMPVQMANRCSWWLAKCGFVVCGITAGYLVQNITLAVMVKGEMQSPLVAGELLRRAFSVSVLPNAAGQWAWYLILLPFLADVAAALVQLVCMLWLGRASGFAIVFAYWALAAFTFHPALFGNLAMPCRTLLCRPDGMHWQAGVLYLCAVCAVCVLAGAVRFQKMDLLNLEKE